jgi:hypothetical protein
MLMVSNAPIRFLICVMAVCLLSGPVCADDDHVQDGTTINLSHDLVRLGIASNNLRPDSPAIDARPLFQAALAYARSHPVNVITVDRGAYYFLTPQDAQAYLSFSTLSNLTVDLADSTISRHPRASWRAWGKPV